MKSSRVDLKIRPDIKMKAIIKAESLGLNLSSYIRQLIQKDLKKKK